MSNTNLNKKSKSVHYFIIGTFVGLYVLVSLISTIHVIDFFSLSNDTWLAVTLAIAFEIGAAASLASIVTLDKMNKTLVYALFAVLTFMQAMGNSYYAFVHLHDFTAWTELFGINEEPVIYQKRILSIISGGILPLVALGFIKSLVDYIKPSEEIIAENPIVETIIETSQDIKQSNKDTYNTEAKDDIQTFGEPLSPSIDESLAIKKRTVH